MKWLQPYINETVENIEKSSNELWDFFVETAEGDLKDFYKYKNSFGKSALYANIALGLSLPELSDALSENMGASSPKTPTGKEEMMQSEGFLQDMGRALDVADRIIAEWDMAGKQAGGFDQGQTRTYKNILKLLEVVKRGPVSVPQEAPQELSEAPMESPTQSLLSPEA
jgi:glutathionylspermidine synthase